MLVRRKLEPRVDAVEMVAVSNPAARAGLDAFAAGVNHRLENSSLPIEFRVLRYRPDRWRPEDSAAIVRLMSWSLSAFHTSDLRAALVRETIGDEWADVIVRAKEIHADWVEASEIHAKEVKIGK